MQFFFAYERDTHNIYDKSVIGTELSISVKLSSLVRRNVCPNFVVIRGVFTCEHRPPKSRWFSTKEKYVEPKRPLRCLPEPTASTPGRYQYIRMELCDKGDVEEFMKRELPEEMFGLEVAKQILFQLAFALHVAAVRFSVKHYDLKLLNVFLQGAPKPRGNGDVVLRYGMGSHVFSLHMEPEHAWIAKLADFGNSDADSSRNGTPVSIAQFSTLDNTPPDFLILGDDAEQGHSHDAFALGLCMFHLFSGHGPYEEIMKEVICPQGFKDKLKVLWESRNSKGYDVVRAVILGDVSRDADGIYTDGDPDETLYNTLYRFLVLFGIPKHKFGQDEHPDIWKAISSLEVCGKKSKFARHQREYSLMEGTNKFVLRARQRLEVIDGAMELLQDLCSFDPAKRATPLDVLNSRMMSSLIEEPGTLYNDQQTVLSFMSFGM
jgi:serine/threonine protein kinase